MGNLLHRTLKMRVLILGLDEVGKTTLLYQLKLGQVVTPMPTIGFNTETICVEGIELTFWDLASGDKIRPFWRQYYKGTQGVIFVIDSCDRDRLSDAIRELQYLVLQDYVYLPQEDELKDCIIMIVANKQDVDGAMSAQEVEDALVGKLKNCRARYVFLKPCSAKDGAQVQEMFVYFAQKIFLKHTGKLEREGYISLAEQEKESQKLQTKPGYKVMLRDAFGGYLKSFFAQKDHS